MQEDFLHGKWTRGGSPRSRTPTQGRKKDSAQPVYGHRKQHFIALATHRLRIEIDTLSFKDLFWQRYCDGVHPVQIFKDAGLDTEIIGRERIDTLVKALRDQTEIH